MPEVVAVSIWPTAAVPEIPGWPVAAVLVATVLLVTGKLVKSGASRPDTSCSGLLAGAS